MVYERKICCCGASSWTRVIAWFQIVGNLLLFILAVVGLASLEVINPEHQDVPNKNATLAGLAIVFIIAVLGVIMGIILLNATNEKRVNFLKTWLIYGTAAIIISIISIILNTVGSSHTSTLGSAIIGGLLIAVNMFAVVVVYVHMKEINEGVFIP